MLSTRSLPCPQTGFSDLTGVSSLIRKGQAVTNSKHTMQQPNTTIILGWLSNENLVRLAPTAMNNMELDLQSVQRRVVGAVLCKG